MSSDQIFNVVIGTAGHIDHGKSSLVRRITGIDPDRLKEEQERGMTIDLGFAAWDLPDGRRVGIIDVPGHERFVKNMVAGATGIDLVVLVIAADDGVMLQTREHLEIMQLIGLERGVVALSKIDLVDPELLEIVVEDTREFLADTFLADAPIMPLSAVTGDGVDAFVAKLTEIVDATAPRDTGGLFRMPIQRVFSAKGHGTVVTGIPISGEVNKGDTLEILPPGFTGRVRGLQAYKATVDHARAGHSTAINLSDVDFHQVHRGMVVAAPGYFEPHNFFEAELTYLASAKKPLVHHTAIRFHTGTAEVLGRVFLLETGALEPGTDALVQFRLDEPIVAAPGDRFVIRQSSPIITIGGGQIVGISEYKLKARDWIVDRVRLKMDTLDAPRERTEILLREAGPSGTQIEQLKKELQLEARPLQDLLKTLTDEGVAIKLPQGGRLIHRDSVDKFGEQVMESLAAFHRDNPKKMYCEAIELRNELMLDPVFFEMTLTILHDAGRLERDRSRVRQKGLALQLSGEEQELYESLKIVYRDGAFNTPRPAQLPEILSTSQDKIAPMLALALEQGDLVQLEENVILERGNFHRAIGMVVRQIQDKGEVISGELRDELATTRKYVIPLLDHLDRIGLTVREGSERILRREYVKVLQREGIELE